MFSLFFPLCALNAFEEERCGWHQSPPDSFPSGTHGRDLTGTVPQLCCGVQQGGGSSGEGQWLWRTASPWNTNPCFSLAAFPLGICTCCILVCFSEQFTNQTWFSLFPSVFPSILGCWTPSPAASSGGQSSSPLWKPDALVTKISGRLPTAQQRGLHPIVPSGSQHVLMKPCA